MNIKNRLSYAFAFVALFGAVLAFLNPGDLRPAKAQSLKLDGLKMGASVKVNLGEPVGAEVIVSNLNNPRGLAFGPEGALYVAEAGRGGDGQCAEGPEGLRCFGNSGSVTRIDFHTRAITRAATGLPSLATQNGSFATGIHDISLHGRGKALFTIGYAGNPASRVLDFGPLAPILLASVA